MVRARHGSALALGLCALAAGAAHAQAPTPIQVGQEVQGTLSSGDPVANGRGPLRVFRFTGQQGQRLSIRMNSTALDSYLSVGRTVAGITDVLKSDDDGGGGTNARVRFTVPRTGEYLIVAQALDSTRTGAFSLMVANLPAPRVAAPLPIGPGQTLSGALEETDPTLTEPEDVFYDTYVIDATAGQRMAIEMKSEAMDSYLEIGRMRGTELEVLRYNDDAAPGETGVAPARQGTGVAVTEATEGEPANLDSRLVFSAPAAGRYLLRARTLGPNATGSYTLSVTALPALRVPTPRPLTLGQTVEGSLATDDALTDEDVHYDAYVIRGRAGQTLEITMASEAFDTFVAFGRMQGGGFEQIDSNDDGENGTNSLLRVRLDRNGEYVVQARSLSAGQTGAYTLTVREAAL